MGPTSKSESGVWVTQAGPDDDAIVGDLYLRSWRAGYEGLVDPGRLEPVAVERAGYDWRSALSDPTSSFGLGFVGSEPAGIAKIGPDPTESIRCTWLELLYVAPEFWGTDVATALADWAVAQSAADGAPLIRLRVVDVQRRARRFYEREGWQSDPDVPMSRNAWFDLLCLRKDLA